MQLLHYLPRDVARGVSKKIQTPHKFFEKLNFQKNFIRGLKFVRQIIIIVINYNNSTIIIVCKVTQAI